MRILGRSYSSAATSVIKSKSLVGYAAEMGVNESLQRAKDERVKFKEGSNETRSYMVDSLDVLHGQQEYWRP